MASDRSLLVIAAHDQIDGHSFGIEGVTDVDRAATDLAILEVSLLIGAAIQQQDQHFATIRAGDPGFFEFVHGF
jgi:hypothetical protein